MAAGGQARTGHVSPRFPPCFQLNKLISLQLNELVIMPKPGWLAGKQISCLELHHQP